MGFAEKATENSQLLLGRPYARQCDAGALQRAITQLKNPLGDAEGADRALIQGVTQNYNPSGFFQDTCLGWL
ncbi:uncharacterized protein PG986_005527 [Apiospora aurea]|uniref:Uncharacterized protein n=1 Tax=Apiospora aurea TaxID=335848 RepID=A0ABR1QI10_9PEZI